MLKVRYFFELFDELGIKMSDEEKILAELQAYIAGKLMAYRKENMLTQKELAKILGFAEDRVAKIEEGSVNLSLKTIAHIIACLGGPYVPIDKRIKMAEDMIAEAKKATDWKIYKTIYSPSTDVAIFINQDDDLSVISSKLSKETTGKELFEYLSEAGFEPEWLVDTSKMI